MSNLTQLDTSFRFYRGRAMDDEELKAAASLTAIPAPLGLTEWRTTDGNVYAKGANAVDVQVGINRRKAETTQPAQEVGLTEAERVRCLIASGCIGTVKMTYDSGPYEITRTSINASRLIDAIIAALRAKGAV